MYSVFYFVISRDIFKHEAPLYTSAPPPPPPPPPHFGCITTALNAERSKDECGSRKFYVCLGTKQYWNSLFGELLQCLV